MAEVTVKTIKNGPYEITGAVALVDHKGNPYKSEDEAIYLCRCGQSANKPFCDGTHSKVGFRADQMAV